MANLYVNKDDQAFVVKVLARYKEELLDDQADDSSVNHAAEITHADKLLRRIHQMGG